MQEAITCTSVDPDLCPHMMSLGHNELNYGMLLLWLESTDIAVWCIPCNVSKLIRPNTIKSCEWQKIFIPYFLLYMQFMILRYIECKDLLIEWINTTIMYRYLLSPFYYLIIMCVKCVLCWKKKYLPKYICWIYAGKLVFLKHMTRFKFCQTSFLWMVCIKRVHMYVSHIQAETRWLPFWLQH